MKMIVHVSIPNQPFSSYVRDGSVGEKVQRILNEIKPEAVYFCEYSGQRGAIMIVNVEDASKVPGISEPWFLLFDARAEFHLAMTQEDLEKSGLDKLGRKWV
jgi:hypothetical protein